MSTRLPPVPGEWIDRQRVLNFQFEGKTYQAFSGDTISSALLASGVRVLGRSFKYHRPRGALSAANHDVNSLMQHDGIPNLRADVTAVQSGMHLSAVNTFGGLTFDKARFIELLSPALPVGFYYKAFHSKKLFPMWERMFRKLAGLGTVDVNAGRARTSKRYGFCDVLVIGAGPAGLSAALAAADSGAFTILVDENARVGGSGVFQLGANLQQRARLQTLIERATAHPRLSVRTATTAAGYYADHWIPLIDAGRMTKVRARAVIVCAGAMEQPAVFRNNDLPGVMLASAAQRLIYRYAVKPFERIVVLAANTDAYRAALDFREHGIEIAAIVDLRHEGETSALGRRVELLGIPIRRGTCIVSAQGVNRIRNTAYPVLPTGDGVALGFEPSLDAGLRSVRTALMRKTGNGIEGDLEEIACDGLAMSVGWAPAANLLYQAGARMRYASESEQFVPAQLPLHIYAAGRVNGVHDFEHKLLDGERAGVEAASALAFKISTTVGAVPRASTPSSHPYPIVAHPRGKNFVDFDEDLVLADFENAAQEGFDNIELLKRFTTVGMGPSQGKHSNMNAIRILARIRNEAVDAVGTTTSRPFFHPVRMAVLAGRGFHPERVTALHERHKTLNARFMLAGQWWRPEYYPVDGAPRGTSIRNEVLAVRQNAGLIDVGTLGKIEISGPGAAEFLERVYTGHFANLRPGMTRYCLMVDEAGVVIDDGVVARVGDDRYYFTTTTSGSATVYRELTRLNAIWQLDCGIVNVTGHVCAMNIAGPKSRQILSRLTRSDLSESSFPYLAVRDIEVAGISVRAMRVGFVGELGYELHVKSKQAVSLWDALLAAGQEASIRPFGVETQRLLRLEKGHLIIGQDTDGLTTPFEAGCGWAVKMDKPFFVGQRSLRILRSKPLRQSLVGFELLPGANPTAVLESHLVIDGTNIAGRITSIAWSPTLSKHIGLAMVRPDLAHEGARFRIRVTDGTMVDAVVVPTPFYDADGKRQKLAAAA